jgi:hypothetical protein
LAPSTAGSGIVTAGAFLGIVISAARTAMTFKSVNPTAPESTVVDSNRPRKATLSPQLIIVLTLIHRIYRTTESGNRSRSSLFAEL